MELTLNTQPAVITGNFEPLVKDLTAEVAKYDIVVTAETVKDAKKLATELNKTKIALDTRRKEEVAKASEPIKLFDNQMKRLVKICVDGRAKIIDQTTIFEAKTLKKAARLMVEYRDSLYSIHCIQDEFQTADVIGLEKLGSLTGTGKLTKSACTEVEVRVADCLSTQQTTHLRLSELENASHRAGLHSPLTREHVEGILFGSDEAYQEGLQRLILREISRQAETERKAREKLKQEAEEKARQEAATLAAAEAKDDLGIAPIVDQAEIPEHSFVPREEARSVEPQEEPLAPFPDTVAAEVPERNIPSTCSVVDVIVTCQFKTKVSPNTSNEAIEAEFRKVLAMAGMKSLHNVTIEKQQ